MCLDVTKDNILSYTRNFLEKAKDKREKPKDEPRYKTVVEYESELKENYKIGLTVALKVALKKYNKLVKDNDFTAIPDTGTA